MPSFIEGDDRISFFVKIHWEGVDVEDRCVGVCGESDIIVDQGKRFRR